MKNILLIKRDFHHETSIFVCVTKLSWSTKRLYPFNTCPAIWVLQLKCWTSLLFTPVKSYNFRVHNANNCSFVTRELSKMLGLKVRVNSVVFSLYDSQIILKIILGFFFLFPYLNQVNKYINLKTEETVYFTF